MKINKKHSWNNEPPVYLDEVAVTGIVFFTVGAGITSWFLAGAL